MFSPRPLRISFLVYFFLLPGVGAISAAPADIESKPLEPAPKFLGPLFSKIPSEISGLVVRNEYDDPEMWGGKYHEFQGGSIGTGIAAGDVDGDGWIDLYVVNKVGSNRLYRQTAPLRFEDITEKAGVPGGSTWGSGASFADVDNDGDLDLYVCQLDAPNLLYINDGRGIFTEGAKAAGIDIASGSVIGAFEDYDHDGDLDLFLLTNVANVERSAKGEPDYLFQNNGHGVFSDVTESAGIESVAEKGHSATWWDANGDGWADLYIANDFEAPDHLYQNNKDGTFSEITEEVLPHIAWFSMGSDFGDINNDGLFDFLVADMASTTHFKQKVAMGDMGGLIDYMDTLPTPQYMVNALFVNNGSEHFLEAARLLGVANTDWTWSPRFEDLDNDGWQDLHVTNGMVRSFNDSDMVNQMKRVQSREQIIAMARKSPPLQELNLVYRNTGEWRFENRVQDWGLEHEGVSFGSVLADLDNDGDIDIVYSNYDDVVSLYQNNSRSHSITVSLKGSESNRYGIGAQLFVESSAGTQARQVSPTRGALSSSIGTIHFGLGRDESVRRLTIRWPSGKVQQFENLAAGYNHTITEAGSKEDSVLAVQDPKSLFADASADRGLEFRNREQPFNDMIRQPLLPNRMNTLGGGLAWGDADGDGDSDLYFCGAKGQSGALYLNDGSGRFQMDKRDQPWLANPEVEEMAALWIDANQDEALDLYVSSGGVEEDAGSLNLLDSLYLNTGNGQFEQASKGALPEITTSSSVVASMDFDRDGDLDLFVGGRVVPGEYPVAPDSMLLENVDGEFLLVGEDRANGISSLGMVTSAIWSDANGDNWPDLLVAGEWEPIRLFINHQGRLVEDTSPENGFANYRGWWNALEAADVDNDGDMDYIACNLGLNTKYHASPEKPVRIYYGDFEGNGNFNIVEAEFEGDKLFPIRGKSCSTRAMPSLGNKFPTFNAFASALLTDIYDVQKAEVYEATELSHGVFVNQGKGSFVFKALPRLAQISIAFGVAARDFNGDGFIDIILGQNFHGPQVETSRFDGGLGLLLVGDGKGNFAPLDPGESGICIPGETRGIAVGDLNLDGWPDLVLTRTNDQVLTLLNEGVERNNSISLKLGGSQALITGAKVKVEYADGSRPQMELYQGSGYLSQSEPLLFVGYQDENPPKSVEVTWSNGESTRLPIRNASNLVIRPGDSLAKSLR